MFKFDLSLISTIVIFNFTFLASEDFNIKLILVISYTPCGNVYPLLVRTIYLFSYMSTTSL